LCRKSNPALQGPPARRVVVGHKLRANIGQSAPGGTPGKGVGLRGRERGCTFAVLARVRWNRNNWISKTNPDTAVTEHTGTS
jgi:hypothetical protein